MRVKEKADSICKSRIHISTYLIKLRPVQPHPEGIGLGLGIPVVDVINVDGHGHGDVEAVVAAMNDGALQGGFDFALRLAIEFLRDFESPIGLDRQELRFPCGIETRNSECRASFPLIQATLRFQFTET